jgi:hypothetical protein
MTRQHLLDDGSVEGSQSLRSRDLAEDVFGSLPLQGVEAKRRLDDGTPAVAHDVVTRLHNSL